MRRLAVRVLSVPTLLALPTMVAAQGGRFGEAVSTADVDGDGFDDVIVGEPYFDGTRVDEGRVLVFRGSATGPEATPSWSQSGLQPNAHFGATVAGLGDVNTDGFEDVAIGAPDFDVLWRVRSVDGPFLPMRRGAGLVTVFLGSAAGLQASPAMFRTGIQGREHVGAALSRAGDVNGDGFDDVLVGATGTNGRRGAALLYPGSASGPIPYPIWMRVGNLPDGGFGSVVSGGGDVNDDGFADVLIGAPDYPPLARGVVSLFLGSVDGLQMTPQWGYTGESSDDPDWDNGTCDWGAAACSASDVNGDGVDDIVLSNPTYDANAGHGAGVIFDFGVTLVFRGVRNGLPTFVDRVGIDGTSCAPAGDLDADGRDDVYISVSEAGGKVCYGSSSDFLSTSPVSVGGGHGAGGDIDGDGFDDFVGGDPTYAVPQADTGQVRIYRGSTSNLSFQNSWVLSVP